MLKDALYHIFIYPLESLLGFVLSVLQGWCHSYGLSIILLSLLVNLFLLKLFFIADKASRNHALIKSKLDKKIAEFKRVFNGGELYAYIKTLYRQNHYHPIYALKALGGLALQVPFFVAVVSLLEFHSPELKGVKFGVIPDLFSPDGLLWGINLLPLLMTFFTLCNVWISSEERGARIQGGIIALVFLVLLYKMPSALLLYWTTSMVFALIKSVCVKYIHLSKKEEKPSQEKHRSFVAKIFNACFTKYSDIPPQDYKLYRNISIFAILNLCTLVFLYNPFALYASDVSQFDPKETWNTLGALFGFFLLTSFLLVYTTSFFYKTRFLKLGTYGFCVVLMIALIYNFLLNYNIFERKAYPAMDGLLFISNFSTPYIAKYLDFCIGLIVMVISFFAIKVKLFLKLIKFLNLFVISMMLYWSCCILVQNEKIQKMRMLVSTAKEEEIKKPYTNILNFSRNKKNILFIIADTVQSDIFMKALREHPQLKGDFEGFVYYPNLVSVSSITYLSIPAIIGGEYYHPINVWERVNKNKTSYKYEVLEAYTNLIQGVKNEGYDVSVWAGYPLERTEFKKKVGNSIEIVNALVEEYAIQQTRKNNAFRKKDKQNSVGDFISFGLFKISPYSIRGKLYTGDGWILGSSLYFSHIYLASHTTSVFQVLKDFAKDQAVNSTLKIIHEESNHFPWVMNSNCKPIENESEYMKKFLVDKNSLVYDNHLCYLKRMISFFQWMKDHDVYNNTKIIIVSDHGVRGYRIETNDVLDIKTQSSHALLLVKDFNKVGELVISQDFKSNTQAFYEICNVFNNSIQHCSKIQKNTAKQRFVFSNRIDFNSFTFDNIFEVTDDIYNLKNWKDITKEFLDNQNKKEKKK